MVRLLYSLMMGGYQIGTRVAAFFSNKARRRIQNLKTSSQAILPKNSVIIHCASLGEYEQGLPIIQWILEHTDRDVIISFFSSSGYDQIVTDHARLYKSSLPFDLTSKMRQWLDRLDPEMFIAVRYEFWWNLLTLLKNRNIPTYLISASFRPDQYFIKYPTPFFRQGMKAFDHIFVVDQDSKKIVHDVYDVPITIAGDTRMDRVIHVKDTAAKHPHLTEKTVIIYGSIWLSDLPIVKSIVDAIDEAIHIVFPHELNRENIEKISKILSAKEVTSLREITSSGTFVFTKMGILKSAYIEASLAYVGGGFGVSVHNVAEAAVYNIPVIFGPNHHKSIEAKELKRIGIGFEVNDNTKSGLLAKKLLSDKTNIAQKAATYFKDQGHASEKICTRIFASNRKQQ